MRRRRHRAPLGIVQPGQHGHLVGRDRYPHDCGCSACATDWWDSHQYPHGGSRPKRQHGTVGGWATGCQCLPCLLSWQAYVAAGGQLEFNPKHRRPV